MVFKHCSRWLPSQLVAATNCGGSASGLSPGRLDLGAQQRAGCLQMRDLGAQQCADRLDLPVNQHSECPSTCRLTRSDCKRAARAFHNAFVGSTWLPMRDLNAQQRADGIDRGAQKRAGSFDWFANTRSGCQTARSICIPTSVRAPSSTLAGHWFSRSG